MIFKGRSSLSLIEHECRSSSQVALGSRSSSQACEGLKRHSTGQLRVFIASYKLNASLDHLENEENRL